jgi:5-methylcytosine-specific restriction endonuclease McrA
MKTLTHSPAPTNKVSPWGQQSTDSPIKKGFCVYCGEVFNLKKDHLDDLICPDCLDIFGDEPEIGQQETGEA